MKKAILSFVGAVLAGAAAVNAATIKYTLALDDNNGVQTAGSWTLYADVTGSTSGNGLASYQVNLRGINTITSSANQGPKAVYTDSTATNPDMNAGFSALRAVTNKGASPQGGTSFEIDASQDTVAFLGDPTSTKLIPDMGIAASSFVNQRPAGYDGQTSVIQATWAGHLMLAKGTYAGSGGTGITPDFSTTNPNAGNVFTNISTASTSAGSIQTTVIPAPEPAAMGLLAVAAGGLITRRRRTA